ncbi:hypothetical protein M408DRAFT_28523 [Serendipita vermifera MAFF 305830]|uniref:Uncharacterized protein n=1 Tax=Serendipita vermifera MAFF 305830 TaxID=933852 RepID=A0A0C3ARM1_SERVB|nr:hypothetical protein M408DRAFT_28523 [Serendipita vermifera MAFF 305830]
MRRKNVLVPNVAPAQRRSKLEVSLIVSRRSMVPFVVPSFLWVSIPVAVTPVASQITFCRRHPILYCPQGLIEAAPAHSPQKSFNKQFPAPPYGIIQSVTAGIPSQGDVLISRSAINSKPITSISHFQERSTDPSFAFAGPTVW